MRRGSTPTFTFRMKDKLGQPFDTSTLSDLRVTFKQGDKIVVDKKLSDCVLSGNTIMVDLNQSETLRFDHRTSVRIQIKGKHRGTGKIITTKIKMKSADEILNEEVL